MKKCKLCNIKHHTKWYYADDKWVVCDCEVCHTPMIIYREHKKFEEIETKELRYIIIKVMELFDGVRFKIDQKENQDHFHWHIIVEDSFELDGFDDVFCEKRKKRA